ncbi:MAG: MoxR family ATPase [bacterium]
MVTRPEAAVSREIEQAHADLQRVIESVESVIFGKRRVVEYLLISMLSGGHVLIEDVPGVGKTMLSRALAKSVELDFKRIQFTPDLLPSDLTGNMVYNQKTGEFYFKQGPLFANMVLADEINRTSPRTQSALLEAMEEQQVTVDGIAHELPYPFFVIATQNPIEHQGTYALPEAQLDRFLLKVRVGYPADSEEMAILESQQVRHPIEDVTPVISPARLMELRELVKTVHITQSIRRYIVRIVNETRHHPDVLVGCSPRGSLGLGRAAQAAAVLARRDYVVPDDIQEMAPLVLGHRLFLLTESQLAGVTPRRIVDDIISRVPVPAE